MLTGRSRSNRSPTRARVVRGASRSLLSIIAIGVPLAIFAQALTSCGSDSEDKACTPGEKTACANGQCDDAVQVCNAEGSALSACACPGDSPGGVGGSGGAAGSSSTGGTSPGGGGAAGAGMGTTSLFDLNERAIGAPCAADTDCPTGPNGEAPLVCMKSNSLVEFGTGGPQGGYCTAVCDDAADSADCQAIDALSACGLLDDATGKGFCIGLCQPNDTDPPGGQVIKCGANRAQACFAFPGSTTVGACFPVCQSDAACGPGLFCDLGANELGLCSPTAPVGGEIGAPCTADTAVTDCKSGLCVELADSTGASAGSFCTANCTFGLIQGCGFDRVATGRGAACLQTQGPEGLPGDLGFCFQLCDTAADCAQPGWECVENFSEMGQAAVGRRGQCLPPGMNAGDAGAP